MELQLIDHVEVPASLARHTNLLEKIGNVLLSPAILVGRNYTLAQTASGSCLLKNHETIHSFSSALLKATLVALSIIFLPVTLVSIGSGLGFKWIAQYIDPQLREKYTFHTLINARTPDNFAGKLPPSPLTPNCVNSQAPKSLWGQTYDTKPIVIPQGLRDPLAILKNVLQTANKPSFKAYLATLVEESGNYLHYTYTVIIPVGPLQGTYTDDVDIYYDQARHCFDIRSASRIVEWFKGTRDSLNAFDFSQPAANKKRVEAIREAFAEAAARS